MLFLRKLLPFRELVLMDRLSLLLSNFSEHEGNKVERQTQLITLWLVHRGICTWMLIIACSLMYEMEMAD